MSKTPDAYKILAKNTEGDGMLPMKESPEREAEKSEQQQRTELCNFIKTAFVVDGDVQLVHSKREVKTKTFFLAEDSKRGMFAVFMINLTDHE